MNSDLLKVLLDKLTPEAAERLATRLLAERPRGVNDDVEIVAPTAPPKPPVKAALLSEMKFITLENPNAAPVGRQIKFLPGVSTQTVDDNGGIFYTNPECLQQVTE